MRLILSQQKPHFNLKIHIVFQAICEYWDTKTKLTGETGQFHLEQQKTMMKLKYYECNNYLTAIIHYGD